MSKTTIHGEMSRIERLLRPDPRRVAQADTRARRIVEELDRKPDAWMYEVKGVVSHGSHSRDTALAAFKDVDYLVELVPDSLRTVAGQMRSPRDTVGRLARALEERRRGLVEMGHLEIRHQDHSVGVKYPHSGYRIDLVPALRQEEGTWLIPEKSTREWISTSPPQLAEHLGHIQARNSRARATIRLLKGWRRARGKRMRIPSYALELWVLDRAASSPASLVSLVRGLLEELARADKRRRLVLRGEASTRAPVICIDPWSGANITADLTQKHKKRLIENARRALDILDEAQEAKRTHGRGVASRLERLFVGPRWLEEVG